MINLETSGFIELSSKLKTGLKPRRRQMVLAVGNYMQTTAKQNLKTALGQSRSDYTRSGKSAQSIVVDLQSDSRARVVQGVNYGRYIEYGTGIHAGRKGWWVSVNTLRRSGWKLKTDRQYIFLKGMKRRPFWIPAVKETRSNLKKIIKPFIQL